MPYVRGLHKDVVELREERNAFQRNSYFPAGHYYSPIVSIDDMKAREDFIWSSREIDGITGIDLRQTQQLGLLSQLAAYYEEMPFKGEKQIDLRYYFANPAYTYTDGCVLYAFIRHLKPKKIIEVGSGFSSALMLDTNELFFENSIDLTFIEPYPELLHSLLSETDKSRVTIIDKIVQSVPLVAFESLFAGDILFIDSTHIAKTGSDVNYILFEILPHLKAGVFIHFHDIFYPFEYPKDWVLKGWNWNEDYILKAFLMYNEKFEIRLFSDYLHKHHKAAFSNMPLTYKNWGGAFWIEKL